MNAGQAGEAIAPFIDSSMQQNRERVFSIMKMALNYAWDKGKWFGMTAEFFVNTRCEPKGGKRYIFAPPGYSTLLAVNVDEQHPTLRDKYFIFHRNGPGDIKSPAHAHCRWNRDVYDMGEYPNMHEINLYFPDGVLVGVRSLGKPGDDEYITFQGHDEDGSVISYEHKEPSKCSCFSLSEDENAPVTRTVHGIRLKITEGFEYINNVTFLGLTKIFKTFTRCPIEVRLIDSKNRTYITAILQPWERQSSYRKYYIPDSCGDCVHALFKISRQPEIIDESQPLIINHENALLSLCKGMQLKFFKEQLVAGDQFLQQGIIFLEEDKRESESPTVFPIQVIGIGVDDIDIALRDS